MHEAAKRFGLPPDSGHRADILAELKGEIAKVPSETEDQELLRFLCFLVFCIGNVEDSLAVWDAKSASMDTFCMVDIELLCGAGLTKTRTFLVAQNSAIATSALNYIDDSELDEFTVASYTRTKLEEYRGTF